MLCFFWEFLCCSFSFYNFYLGYGKILRLSTRGTGEVGLESTWTHVPLNLRKIYWNETRYTRGTLEFFFIPAIFFYENINNFHDFLFGLQTLFEFTFSSKAEFLANSSLLLDSLLLKFNNTYIFIKYVHVDRVCVCVGGGGGGWGGSSSKSGDVTWSGYLTIVSHQFLKNDWIFINHVLFFWEKYSLQVYCY